MNRNARTLLSAKQQRKVGQIDEKEKATIGWKRGEEGEKVESAP